MSFFSSFFGDEELKDIDNRIDALINQFPTLNRQETSDTISSDFVSSFMENAPKEEIDRLLQSVSVSRDRLERYNIYDEAYRYVPIIKRMVKVYIANILQKNPVTGKSLLIRPVSDTSLEKELDVEIFEHVKKFAEVCLKTFDLAIKLRNKILPITLVYGDCFVEVVDINAEAKKKESANILNTVALFESNVKTLNNRVEQLQYKKNGNVDQQVDVIVSRIAECLTEVVDNFAVYNFEEKQENEQNINVFNLDNILLKIHKPHNIVILQTDYGSILGYLEVAKDETPMVYNLTQTLSTLVGRVTSILGRDVVSQENITDRLVRYIVKTTLEKANRTPSSGNESLDSLLKGLDPSIFNYIKRLVVEHGLSQRKLQLNRIQVRFIPVSRMVPFSLLSSEYDPYGGSFIDPLTFHSKLYILSQLANVILKLSRAAPVRKWTIDIGATQMHAGMIQKLKRELYNTRVTLDDISSFKSIPKILSDFKDMFILAKGGNKPIDVEIASHGDPTVRVADLEDARREIMSLSGIPPAYLGYADVIELREQLVHTNVAFATEIVDIQENVTGGLNKIIDIIAQIKDLKIGDKQIKPSEYVQIGLIPPITLILQLIEMSLSSIGNINGIFQTLQTSIDPYYFLQQYIPYINWDEFKKKADQYVLLQQTKAKVDAASGEGGG